MSFMKLHEKRYLRKEANMYCRDSGYLKYLGELKVEEMQRAELFDRTFDSWIITTTPNWDLLLLGVKDGNEWFFDGNTKSEIYKKVKEAKEISR
jgi:hypothetical protein